MDDDEGPGLAWIWETLSVKCFLLISQSFTLSANLSFVKLHAHKSSPNQRGEIKTLQSRSHKTGIPMTKYPMLLSFQSSSFYRNDQLISWIVMPMWAFRETWYIPCRVTSCRTPQLQTNKSCTIQNRQIQPLPYSNLVHQYPIEYCLPWCHNEWLFVHVMSLLFWVHHNRWLIWWIDGRVRFISFSIPTLSMNSCIFS